MLKFFKRRRSNKLSIAEVKEPDEQFAKVDNPKSSMDDTKDMTSDREIKWDAFDEPAQSSVPSLVSDRSCVIRSPSPVPTIQLPHYEVYALPEPTVSGEVLSRHSCDSFDEPDQALDTSTSFLLDATPPRTRRRYTESAADPEAGLKALFEKPTRPNRHPEPLPSEPAPLQIRSDNFSLSRHPLHELPDAAPDIPSHPPLVPKCDVHELPSETGLKAPQIHAQTVKPLLILTPPQAQSDAEPTRQLDSETSRSMQDEPSPSQKIALAQVFMYQARMTGQSAYGASAASAVTDEGISFKSKTSGPQLSPAARAEVRRPRSVSTSSIATMTNSPLSYNKAIVPRPLQAGFATPELDGSEVRRKVVDSEAWRRKSRMFQLDSFSHCTGVAA